MGDTVATGQRFFSAQRQLELEDASAAALVTPGTGQVRARSSLGISVSLSLGIVKATGYANLVKEKFDAKLKEVAETHVFLQTPSITWGLPDMLFLHSWGRIRQN